MGFSFLWTIAFTFSAFSLTLGRAFTKDSADPISDHARSLSSLQLPDTNGLNLTWPLSPKQKAVKNLDATVKQCILEVNLEYPNAQMYQVEAIRLLPPRGRGNAGKSFIITKFMANGTDHGSFTSISCIQTVAIFPERYIVPEPSTIEALVKLRLFTYDTSHPPLSLFDVDRILAAEGLPTTVISAKLLVPEPFDERAIYKPYWVVRPENQAVNPPLTYIIDMQANNGRGAIVDSYVPRLADNRTVT